MIRIVSLGIVYYQQKFHNSHRGNEKFLRRIFFPLYAGLRFINRCVKLLIFAINVINKNAFTNELFQLR